MKKDLKYWKQNAIEDYKNTPISVLRYISELEEKVNNTRDLVLYKITFNNGKVYDLYCINDDDILKVRKSIKDLSSIIDTVEVINLKTIIEWEEMVNNILLSHSE